MIYAQRFRTAQKTIYRDPDGRFRVSTNLYLINGEWRTYVHFTVTPGRFSPSTLREIDRIFPICRAMLPPVIAAITWEDTKLFAKFASRYGFVPTSKAKYDDGVERTIWFHFL